MAAGMYPRTRAGKGCAKSWQTSLPLTDRGARVEALRAGQEGPARGEVEPPPQESGRMSRWGRERAREGPA